MPIRFIKVPKMWQGHLSIPSFYKKQVFLKSRLNIKIRINLFPPAFGEVSPRKAQRLVYVHTQISDALESVSVNLYTSTRNPRIYIYIY